MGHISHMPARFRAISCRHGTAAVNSQNLCLQSGDLGLRIDLSQRAMHVQHMCSVCAAYAASRLSQQAGC